MHAAPGLADEGLDLLAGVEAALADADQLLGLGYNPGADCGTTVRATVTTCKAR
jgi:hypothetical protein